MTASPCRGICHFHEDYLICVGCRRSRLEVKLWHRYSEAQKKDVIEGCKLKETLYGDLV